MTGFVALALVLGLLVLGAVFAPLVRARGPVGIALVALGLVTTAALYAGLGTPAALDPAARTAPATLAEAVQRLEGELRRDPRQPDGWRLLADAYRAQGRMADMARAYARALELSPADPDLLAQAAEARALAAPDRRFDAEAVALLERALATTPEHERARWFLGVAQRQAGRPADAARTWEPLLARVQPGAAVALRQQVDAARAEAGLAPLPSAPTTGAVGLRVEIAPTLRAQIREGAALFVLARRVGGPPMPVAARRLPANDLPVDVRLTDADSLMPTAKLSSLDRVEVVARIAQTGAANARPGDLESAAVEIAAGGSATLRIDRVRP